MCTDGEYPEIYNETYPKARKQHKCCECSSDIDKGEKYQYISGLWDDFEVYKTCMICHNIRCQAQSELDYNIAFTCLYEAVGSEFEEYGI